MRIGVNHGSLAERMLFTYGDTPQGMVESALECIRICRSFDFHNLIISMKASRVPVMVAAYRLLAQRMDAEGMDYPIHLGVTEAGDGEYGRIKSTAGLPHYWPKGSVIRCGCHSPKRQKKKSPSVTVSSKHWGCGRQWWST